MNMKKANLVLAAALAAAGVTSVATGLLMPATAIAQAFASRSGRNRLMIFISPEL